MIYSGRDKHERGVGIIFDETTQKSLDSWFPVSDRIIVAKIKAKPFDIGIIQAHQKDQKNSMRTLIKPKNI